MKTNIARLLLGASAVAIFLAACQKESSQNIENKESTEVELKMGGAIEDDPAVVAKVPTIMSSEFYNSKISALGARGSTTSKKDSDSDGIPDVSDACPQQKETINGYQDNDGCPDTAPTASKDSDGDGIIDTQDACVNEPETVNGYQDNDGCPDSPPVVLPPTNIPASFQLATPPVGNQGNEGACVPFAVAYAARSIEQYYKTNATSYNFTTNVFSPEYVYNQTKFNDCGTGTSPTTVLDLIKNQGVATWASMPYSDVNGCSLQPNASQTANASAYKINSYVMIPNSDRVAIKTMIASKHAVIITIIADNSFTNAGPGFTWKAYSGSGALRHTLIICGYDDAKNAYKVMNSWGSSWGDAGYSWIDYDFFPQKAVYDTYAIQ